MKPHSPLYEVAFVLAFAALVALFTVAQQEPLHLGSDIAPEPPGLAEPTQVVDCTAPVDTTDGVRVRAGLDRCALSPTPSTRNLVVEVASGSASVDLPVQLTLVLDTSGSMTGAPLDAAKLAAISLIRAMRPSDRVSVLAFNDTVTTALPMGSVDHATAEAAIRRLTAGGGTAIRRALEQAVLMPTPAAWLGRVVLLSDGQDAMGQEAAMALGDRFASSNLLIETYGLGTSVNDVLLSHLALRSGGTFHFVPDPGQIGDAFATALASARAVALRDVDVTLPPGVGVTSVLLRPSTTTPDGATRVHLGDVGVYPRHLVAKVLVTRATDQRPVVITGRLTDGRPYRRELRVGVLFTDDPAELALGVDRELADLAAATESHLYFEAASVAAREGRAADARRIATEGRAALSDPAGAVSPSALQRLGGLLEGVAAQAAAGFSPNTLSDNFDQVASSVNGAL